tara:strand:- start:5432 stop:5701 length:270 start_codon:yes stop_codon:yes gene_type:complete
MSDLISGGEASDEKEAPTPNDLSGAIKFVAMIVGGFLAILGISTMDMFSSKKEADSKDDEETQADYEKEYLDEDISEDALDEHTVGLTS